MIMSGGGRWEVCKVLIVMFLKAVQSSECMVRNCEVGDGR